MSEPVFIGIDVSRDTLEVGSSAKASTRRHGNDTAGIEALTAGLVALAPELVVLEATGGHEFEAACALQAAGLAVAVVNPRQARDFVRAMGHWPRPTASMPGRSPASPACCTSTPSASASSNRWPRAIA